MDKKTYAIGILTITAVVLLVGNLLPQQTVSGGFAVAGDDYQMIVARGPTGSDTLYVVNRDGKMALFTWDANGKTLKLQAWRLVADMFGGGGKGG
jgi:hypothetical protein